MSTVVKKDSKNPFSNYSDYVSGLKQLAQQPCIATGWRKNALSALNGQSGIELQRVTPLETRRHFGAFFTGTDLSKRLIAHGSSLNGRGVFYDPTCGMGDLLLAAAKKLPLRKTLSSTLRYWGRHLAGTDLHKEFVEGTMTRLVLLARQRLKSDEVLKKAFSAFFPQIRVGDGHRQHAKFAQAGILLLNPPFGQVEADDDCSWAGGRITEAAKFVITALERIRPGVEMLAILPDVLRSGSFTERWRDRVSELAEVHLVESYGIFDSNADIDVFLLRLTRRKSRSCKSANRWPPLSQQYVKTISSSFDVHVGRVVPHRDKKSGPRYPYIHPRCIPMWKVINSFSETRKYNGLVYAPPFVVIRRTSRPGHPYRAAATVISGKKTVAVENHLIVCKPKDKLVKTCKDLMRQLKTKSINKYLDKRIRCRHLTVKSVGSIPFKQK